MKKGIDFEKSENITPSWLRRLGVLFRLDNKLFDQLTLYGTA